MVLTDWRDHVPGWVFRGVVYSVPLAWILGPKALFVAGAIVLLSFGLLVVGRLGEVAKVPLSFCLPGFRVDVLPPGPAHGASAVGLGMTAACAARLSAATKRS